METTNIIAICLSLLFFVIFIYGGHKASKENLLLILKIDSIVLLCFLPILILMLFLFSREYTDFMKELMTNWIFTISILFLFCMPVITLIQYLLKRRKESQEVKNRTEAEIEVSQHKKRLRKIMIPACILPILVIAGLLIFDKSLRNSTIVLTIFILIICVEFILLIWLMRKLK
ncbi:MAG: hypothetical protein II945_08695 [Bacteroidales bacterium]|nr:hypothetical protein [Bacteroidales bacterium]